MPRPMPRSSRTRPERTSSATGRRRTADRLGGAAVGAGRVRVRLAELEQSGERVEAVGDLAVVHDRSVVNEPPLRGRKPLRGSAGDQTVHVVAGGDRGGRRPERGAGRGSDAARRAAAGERRATSSCSATSPAAPPGWTSRTTTPTSAAGAASPCSTSRSRRCRRLVGALPLPHFENEDVDLCGEHADRRQRPRRGRTSARSCTWSASPTRRRRRLSAVLPLGLTGSGRGSGHIANFVKADCSQAWVDGGDLVEVVDLTDPERAEVARQVRVGGVAERRLQGHARHRARQHRHALVGRRRRRGRLQADRQPARAAAARRRPARPAATPRPTTTSSSTTRSGAGRRC